MSDSIPAFLNGEFMPLEQVSISPLDRGFLFGDGIYEVVPAFGKHFLDLDGHLDRLANSLAGVQINNPYSDEEWRSMHQRLLESHPATDKKVYVQVTRGVQVVRDHDFKGDEAPTVFAMCTAQSPPSAEMLKQGIALFTEDEIRWARCHLKTTSLLPNVLLKHAALEKGGAEALIVRDGRVVEGSSSNVFVVFGNVVCTPPTGREILPGITRNLAISLARELGLEVRECELSLERVGQADEVWISSSTRGVLAVSRIDGNPVGAGHPGPVWRNMYESYQRMIDELRNG